MKRIAQLTLMLLVVAASHAQKVKPELNLTKGEVYTQKLSSDISIVQTVNGQTVNTSMTIGGITSYKVIDIQNSVYDLEVCYQSLSFGLKSSTGVTEYSSEKNDANDILSSVLSLLKNKPFRVKMTKTGKVTEVSRMENLYTGIFEKFPDLPEVQKQQIKNQLTQSYGEKAIKGNLEMCTAIFPDAAVKTGDKWMVNIRLESGISVAMETTFELKETGDTYYRISGNSNVTTTDKETYSELNGMPARYDIGGTMTSDIKINKKTGWVIETTTNQKISGIVEIKDSPSIPGGIKFPMELSTVMIITEK